MENQQIPIVQSLVKPDSDPRSNTLKVSTLTITLLMRVFQYEIQKNRKECTRLAAASNKVYQWFSPGTPASSTTKTGHHDIAEILLKVALTTINQIKLNQIFNMKCKEPIHVQQESEIVTMMHHRNKKFNQ